MTVPCGLTLIRDDGAFERVVIEEDLPPRSRTAAALGRHGHVMMAVPVNKIVIWLCISLLLRPSRLVSLFVESLWAVVILTA